MLEKEISGDAASEVITIPPPTRTLALKIHVHDLAGKNTEMHYLIRSEAPPEGTTSL